MRPLVLFTLLAAGCAEGSLDDLGDAALSGEVGEFDAGGASDDVFVVPTEEVSTGVDVVTKGPDVVAAEDLPSPFEDRVTELEDRASAPEDRVSVPEDRGAPAPDVVEPPRDVPRADVGLSCASPLTACGDRCVNTGTDALNCGACGATCGASTPMCAGGRCASPSCGTGASDCDGDSVNGCETSHMTQGSCAAATNLGTWCGDTSCGFLCPGNSSRVVATRTGRAGAWLRGRTNECSNCPARIEVSFTLAVPPGIDYDLYVYDACSGAPIGRSLLLEGQTDRVTISRGGDLGSDSFNWYVEVRYVRGTSCMPWTLTVNTRSNSGSDC